MTHIEDIVRQVETLMTDTRDPPTLTQKEISKIILHKINRGMADFQGRY